MATEWCGRVESHSHDVVFHLAAPIRAFASKDRLKAERSHVSRPDKSKIGTSRSPAHAVKIDPRAALSRLPSIARLAKGLIDAVTSNRRAIPGADTSCYRHLIGR